LSENPKHSGFILPRTGAEPTFDEPWQARVIAIVSEITGKRGHVNASVWADALGAKLRKNNPDPEITAYYTSVLGLLETELTRAGLLTTDEIGTRIDAWTRAYETTPHGQPVSLESTKTGHRKVEGKTHD
jgi:hypothetical protein